jgi:hypothetical protein
MVKLTLFAQIIAKLDRQKFHKLVKQHQSDKHQKGFNSWTHLVSMLFCHFAKSQSVRDISNGLRSATGNLNHLGVEVAPSKSTLSYQNKRRGYELFKDYYYHLLESLGQHPEFRRIKFRIKSRIFLLDSTTISLCLSLFDWARYRTTKGAVKMHTLLDYEGGIPAYVNITEGKTADNKAAFGLPTHAGSVLVADRFYADFALLNHWDSTGVHFVVRHKHNLCHQVVEQRQINPKRNPEVRSDEIIELVNDKTREKYPGRLRRVVVFNDEHGIEIELLTNQMSWTAATIGQLYKSRWQVEIFFREIKQCLHIKSFIGTSQNAVMIQIWTALITILMLKALKAIAQFKWHLSNLVAFVRLNIFVKIDLHAWLNKPFEEPDPPPKLITHQLQGVLF